MSNQQKGSLKGPIWLMVAPGLLIVFAFLVYAIVYALTGQADTSSDFTSDQPAIVPVINILLFVMGAIGVMAFVPCLIIGGILIGRRKKQGAISVADNTKRSWGDLK